MQYPESAALILESGRVVLTSLHRPEGTPAALQNLLNNLKKARTTCPDKPKVTTTNIVCSSDP
jgi:TATA-box binding protein (TBP) (component of TFIID and TFIIIB)